MAILTKHVLMGKDIVRGALSGELLVADQGAHFSGKNLDSALAALIAKVIADDATGAAAALAGRNALSAAAAAESTARQNAEAAIQTALDTQEAKEAAFEVSSAAAMVAGDAAERAHAVAARAANESARDTSEAAAIATAAAAERVHATAGRLALSQAATAESTARQSAEAAIDARVDAILSGSSESLDQFVEVVAAYTAADGNLQTSVTNLSNAALAGRNAIQADVDQNEADGDTDRAAIRSEFAAADTAAAAANLAARNAIITQHGTDDAAAATARGVIQADVNANELEEKGRMDAAGGFTVDSTASSWEMGWGAGKPKMEFSIDGAVVTMSVVVA
jgi:hypothetical protein